MVKKELAIKAYLTNIRPYLRGIINDFKKLEEWKIHLEIKMNFMWRKDCNEKQLTHSKSKNVTAFSMQNNPLKSFLTRFCISIK